MAGKSAKELLAAAQDGNAAAFAAAISEHFSQDNAADYGRIAHAKSGDALLHVLARTGSVDCIRFLLEQFSGKQFVDIEIRYAAS